MLAVLVRGILTDLLGHVIICKTDHAADNEQSRDGDLPPAVRTNGKTYNSGKDAETADIAERIYLNAETLFLGSPVFFSPGDLPVEHVAYAGDEEADDSGERAAVHSKEHAGDCGYETDVSEINGVVIKA